MRGVYLDNSATSYPKPMEVRQTVARALSYLGANPGRSGYAMAQATAQAVYGVRKKAAAFFGADGPENVVFTKNCTEALNIVMLGLLNPGDHLVISDLEHNAVSRPAKELEARGVSCTVFKTFPGENDKTVDSLRRVLKENTRLVVCTAASNVFGFRLPVARLGALCHIYEIPFCVDGAQAAGIIPLHMQADAIDYLCVPAHKGLYGPMGAGMLLARGTPRPLLFGGTGTNSQSPHQPEELPERLESGTINVPGILGLGAGLDFVSRMGVKRIHKEEMGKLRFLYNGMAQNPAVKLYTGPPDDGGFVPVLSFNVEGLAPEETGELLGRQGIALRSGLHCAPFAHRKMETENGTVRLSPSVFTTREELGYFLAQLKRVTRAAAKK